MYIQCTKKLLAKLDQPYEKLPNPLDPFYSWHASFVEHRKVCFAVMMNDETGEDLYFPFHSFQGFAKQILKAMKQEIKEDGASAKEIAAYFKDAGPPTFGPTLDSSSLARLSGSTRRMKKIIDQMHAAGDLLDEEDRRRILGAHLDNSADSLEEDQEKPKSKTKSKSASKSSAIPMVHLDVALHMEGDEKVERSFFVPLNTPFDSLHVVLQIGFGWTDSHPHEFSNADGTILIGKDLGDVGIDQEREMLNEETTLLAYFIPRLSHFTYRYDYGDSFEHVIKVGKIKTIEGAPYAFCTGGQGSTPVENGEEPSDYEDEEERLELLDNGYVIEFDQERINEDLRELEFVLVPSREK
jgi:hypothetical protein